MPAKIAIALVGCFLWFVFFIYMGIFHNSQYPQLLFFCVVAAVLWFLWTVWLFGVGE